MDVRTKDYENKSDIEINTGLSIGYGIAIIILVVPILVAAIYGWNKHDTKVSNCTGITSATLYDSTQTSQLMSRTYGGPVYTLTKYCDYYECEINGERHTAMVWSYSPLPDVGLVDVYYNPNDIAEYFFDSDVFNDNRVMFDGRWDSRTGSETFWYQTF